MLNIILDVKILKKIFIQHKLLVYDFMINNKNIYEKERHRRANNYVSAYK